MRQKLLVGACLLTFLSIYSQAQKRTYLGLVAGGQLSSSYIEHTLYIVNLSTSYINSFQGGLQYKYYNEYNPNLKMNSGFQTGLFYSQKGWRQVFGGLYPGINTRLDYLVLPVDGIVYWGNEDQKFSLIIGIYGEYIASFRTPETPADEVLEISDFYTYDNSRDKQFGYGLKLGGSYLRDFSFGILEFSGFFDYSLSNFMNSPRRADPLPDTSNLFNFGLTVGYFIPLN